MEFAAQTPTVRGAAQVGACTPLVIEPIGHLARVEARPQLVEHAATDHASAAMRFAIGSLREPQSHMRHVELRRVVLRTEPR